MQHGSNGTLGRFHVELELANNRDMVLAQAGHLPPDQVRRQRINGIVDSGAVELVLPKSVADALGLTKIGTVNVRYADHRHEERDKVSQVWVQLLGREDVFSAVVEPTRTDALIGAVVLEILDLLVDCKTQKLAPRDPKGIICAIE